MSTEIKLDYAEYACNSLPYGICSLNWDFHILWANQKFYDLMGGRSSPLIKEFQKDLTPQSCKNILNLLSGKTTREKIYFQNEKDQLFGYSVKTIYNMPQNYITFIVTEFGTLSQKLAMSLEDLRCDYYLTKAEVQVAYSLALGLSCHDMSKARNTSIPTIRAQIRSLREKMNVPTQLEVISKIYAHCLLGNY